MFPRFLLKCAIIAMLVCTAGAAWTQNFSGTVVDEKQAPLPTVNIVIPALKRGTVTDIAGNFKFEKLPAGIYAVQFSHIGYKTENRDVNLSQGNVTLTVKLQVTALTMSRVTVTAKPQATDVLSSPQSVTIVDGPQLERQRGQSIMQSIENNPGVSTFATGTNIVKPVIRGLTSQRVLVVTDGIRQEGNQWAEEHGPEIDALDVDRIEVVRGPNSVLYGSDALGGVVNIIKGEIPSAEEGAPLLAGKLLLNGFSNNHQTAGALMLSGASGIWGYRANVSARNGGDISTPAGKLFNSGAQELNGSGMIGAEGAWGSVMFDYSRFGQELQIHEDPAEDPTATPFQKIQHDRVHLHGHLPFSALRLEVDGGWQRNDRKEFEEENAATPVLNLLLKTSTLDVKAHHQPLGPIFGTFGISLMQQNHKSPSEEQLIPTYDLNNIGGFIYEELSLNKVNLSAGLRYDARRMEVQANDELGVEAQTRDYNAFTGTAGLVWRATEPLALALNAGRGWRAPTPFELFVNGVHEGTVRYEIGDNRLRPESSLSLDLAVRYASNRWHGEIAVFRNQIDRYIFIAPAGAEDPESGFPIYRHQQADATLIGTELAVEAQALKWLILTGGVDLIRGANDETNNPLPLLPANRLKLGARLTRAALGGLKNPYFAFNAKIVAAQNRVEVFETTTEGYALFDVGLGAEVPLGSDKLAVDLAVENFFNKAYRDHLNRYKLYAFNPGRNVTLKVSLPFTVVR